MTGEKEPTWFDEDGQMNLEAPEDTVAAGLARRMAQADVDRQHKTALIEGDFSPDRRPVTDQEAEAAAGLRMRVYDSARTGCFLIPHRDVELFFQATRLRFLDILQKNQTLKAAHADGRMPGRVLMPMTAGSKLGLILVAAGHGWSPDMLAKHLVMEEAVRAGDSAPVEQDRI